MLKTNLTLNVTWNSTVICISLGLIQKSSDDFSDKVSLIFVLYVGLKCTKIFLSPSTTIID